ncbi:MAG: hypothetical protein DRN95_04210 [Candidatus Hydrothermarchaeota archaeon]|nr:MAG: hypothetical protein DRN95_04210 [Candidatus Hydrothermarchaeota archaeon]
MSMIISMEEIKEFEKLKILSHITIVKEKIKLFENKYKCKFENFENKVKKEKEEFEKWDDYIEWKAYVDTLRYLERKLRDVDNAKDIRIA